MGKHLPRSMSQCSKTNSLSEFFFKPRQLLLFPGSLLCPHHDPSIRGLLGHPWLWSHTSRQLRWMLWCAPTDRSWLTCVYSKLDSPTWAWSIQTSDCAGDSAGRQRNRQIYPPPQGERPAGIPGTHFLISQDARKLAFMALFGVINGAAY